MNEEYTISYDILIHPDLEAIARRDNFLNDNHNVNIIQMDTNGIVADLNTLRTMVDEIHLLEDILDCNNCEYPNECENCARAIEDRER